MGYFYISAAIVLLVATKLLYKKAVHGVSLFPLAIITQCVGSVVSLLLYFFSAHTVNLWTPRVFLLLGINILVWAIIAVVNFIGIREMQVSIRETLVQSRVLFVAILGSIFLGESVGIADWVGVVLIVLGIAFAVYKKGKMTPEHSRGALIVIGTSFLIAVAAILDKYLVGSIDVNLYAFIVYAVPGIIILAFMRTNHMRELRTSFKTKKILLLAGIPALTGTFGYISSLYGFRLLDIHIAYPLLQTTTIITIIAGIILFHERTSVPRKIFGAIVAVAGVIIIKLLG